MLGQSQQTHNSTAVLAATFGMMLLSAERESVLDQATARELAVLARVLEGRLVALRHQLASAAEVRDVPCLEAAAV